MQSRCITASNMLLKPITLLTSHTPDPVTFSDLCRGQWHRAGVSVIVHCCYTITRGVFLSQIRFGYLNVHIPNWPADSCLSTPTINHITHEQACDILAKMLRLKMPCTSQSDISNCPCMCVFHVGHVRVIQI